jgi:predicted HAD superfamily Cof-like phosphohydrolase
MDKCFLDVLDFHKLMASDKIGSLPGIPPQAIADLRMRLIDEEYVELREAWNNDDVPKFADSIIDLIYVLVGAAISYGVDLRPLWDEVQRANMSKIHGEVRPDGKRLKPKDFVPPDIAGLLARQEPII